MENPSSIGTDIRIIKSKQTCMLVGTVIIAKIIAVLADITLLISRFQIASSL